MAKVVKVKAADGTQVEYIDEPIGEGGMKIAYFSPDKKDVIAFFKTRQDFAAEERLNNIISTYNPGRDPVAGSYWENLFCWPKKMVKDSGRLGVVVPSYASHFFFNSGPMKGKEKEAKWFTSPKLRKLLDSSERGTWFDYLYVSMLVSRAVRKMHISGLAHSDLSYKNVLINPQGRQAAIIDIDGLVVPGRYPPDVLGTPDFIAPEVYRTLKLDLRDPKRSLPSRQTDLHALPVLIYMYLLYRHPLRGGKVHDLDPNVDEQLSMGEKAIFIEHPTDKTNRPKDLHPAFMPWADVNQVAYKITGPYLSPLFEKAFIDGLHNPQQRPTASDWEVALLSTCDLLQPCGNSKCEQKWFVFDNSLKPKCPFCGWEFKGQLPVLNLYSARKAGNFGPDNQRLMVYHQQYLFAWHVNRTLFPPNERLTAQEKKPVGYFSLFKGKWVLVNQNIPKMKDLTANKDIAIGSMVELTDGKQILLDPSEGGRLVFVQMVNC